MRFTKSSVINRTVLFALIGFVTFSVLWDARGQSGQTLKDVPFQFEKIKLDSAKSALGFFRTFPLYFFVLEKENQPRQKFITANWQPSGWCLGDTHLENFGSLLLNSGKAIFTMNDWDDAGPCPLILDIYRLAVSVKLMQASFDVLPILEAFERGRNGAADSMPINLVNFLLKKQNEGTVPSKEAIQNGKLSRTATEYELNTMEKIEIAKVVAQLRITDLPDFEWIDSVRTAKISGGSSGLLRYQILLKNKTQFLHLELKEEGLSSIYPVLRAPQPPTPVEKLTNSLWLTQQNQWSKIYRLFMVAGRPMMLRPQFAGNSSINVSDFNGSDLKLVLAYESNLLGLLHSKSSKPGINFVLKNRDDFDKDVIDMADFIRRKFQSLHSF